MPVGDGYTPKTPEELAKEWPAKLDHDKIKDNLFWIKVQEYIKNAPQNEKRIINQRMLKKNFNLSGKEALYGNKKV
ncbi:MAG: hypothetical protein ACM3O3_01650 [Syntrophothermus sp.]